MPTPLITVGVTTYNAEKTITGCIQSVFAQRWKHVEVVVVDDSSEDSTVDILTSLSQDYPLKIIVTSRNLGVAGARNQIIANAQGDFIAFFDDDDESDPERLSLQYSRIVEYEQRDLTVPYVICHTARVIRYPDETSRVEGTMGQNQDEIAPNGNAVASRILMGTPLSDGYGSCATCSQMARRSTYEKLGGFDIEFRRSEDTEFNVRLAMKGGHFVGISTPLVKQRMTATSDKSLDGEIFYRNLLLKKHRTFIETMGSWEFSLKFFKLRSSWLKKDFLSFMGYLMMLVAKHPVRTFERLSLALPNIGLNSAFRQFHAMDKDS